MTTSSRSIFSLITVLAFMTIGLSGCLKTRAQLRDDSDERGPSRPTPAHPVEDVRPQAEGGNGAGNGGGYAIDELKAEFTRMEGRIEDLERSQKDKDASNKSLSQDREELKKLDARLQLVEQSQANITEELKKLHDAPPLVDSSEVFAKAKAQYADQDYEGAAESFASYLKIPRVKKTDEATFLKAECYYKLKQYKKAIVEYSKFPEKFTRSNLMSEALYKIGLSFDALGMRDDAKGFYQEIIEKYPKSPEAKKARKKVK